MSPPISSRPYDIVVFGATGFSGRLLAEYLVKNYIGEVKLAIAGRNQGRLEAVRTDLAKIDARAASLPILIGNSDNLEQLVKIAEQAKVVATTVGPYFKYGTALVEACAVSGTSYCDLTGEPSWHATMYNRFEETAKKTGARIVHQCGFDSVPSDIGSMLAAKTFKEQFGRSPEEIKMFISLRGGGVQGGTIDTVINEIENGKEVARVCKESRKGAPAMHNVGKTKMSWIKGVYWSNVAKRWCIPFFMAGANMPYVGRSNGRLGYSPQLVYSEQMMFRSLFKALFMYFGMLSLGIMLYFKPTRALLMKFVLPSPGQGPSREVCEKASYKVLLSAMGGHDRADVTIDAVGDASCISTTCCLAESAMALSKDRDSLTSPGGVTTAAAAMGDVLLGRLHATPLFRFDTPGSNGASKSRL